MLVSLLGRPGSGKTSAVAPVAEQEDVLLVRVSKLLKAAAGSEPHTVELRRQLESGGLVETDLVHDTVARRVRSAGEALVILDGFPRTESQIEPLRQIARSSGRELAMVLVLALPRTAAERRLTGRRVCARCSEIYNIHSHPPPPDACRCGGELQRREDDRPAVVRQRQDQFDRTTKPVIRWFGRHRPDLLRCVRAHGSQDRVQADLVRVLAERWSAPGPHEAPDP